MKNKAKQKPRSQAESPAQHLASNSSQEQKSREKQKRTRGKSKPMQLWSPPQKLYLNLTGPTTNYISVSKCDLNPCELFTSLSFKLQGLTYLAIPYTKAIQQTYDLCSFCKYYFILFGGGSEEGRDSWEEDTRIHPTIQDEGTAQTCTVTDVFLYFCSQHS